MVTLVHRSYDDQLRFSGAAVCCCKAVLHCLLLAPCSAVRSFGGQSVAGIDQCCSAGVSLRASVGFFASNRSSKSCSWQRVFGPPTRRGKRNVTPKALVHD